MILHSGPVTGPTCESRRIAYRSMYADSFPSCATCQLSSYQCPGHFGHIELPVPVYHPLFMNQAYGLLRSICMYCHKFKMPEIVVSRA